jgi:hypothetical protein
MQEYRPTQREICDNYREIKDNSRLVDELLKNEELRQKAISHLSTSGFFEAHFPARALYIPHRDWQNNQVLIAEAATIKAYQEQEKKLKPAS